jgi:hypothetical protein
MWGLEWRDNEWLPGQWKLTIFLGDPSYYYLNVPAWAELIRTDDHQIRLSDKQYPDPGAVAQVIFEATKTILVDDKPGAWQAIWSGSKGSKKDKIAGTRGLKTKLLEDARLEETSADWKRNVQVAEMLLEKIARARQKDEPDPRGLPVLMADGMVWVRWMKIWESEIAMRLVTTSELQVLSRAIGIGPKDIKVFPPSGEKRARYMLIGHAQREKLKRICEVTDAQCAARVLDEEG